MTNNFSHIDEKNYPTMVDVSEKSITTRIACARGEILIGEEVFKQINAGDIQTKKGPVFATAIIAGTMACKKTSEIIPFCHPLLTEGCKIKITPDPDTKKLIIDSQVTISGKTGVEMEALVAVSTTALTIYDMCKAISSDMVIGNIHLFTKTGGKSDYQFKG